jgi:hypothetical protein
MELAGLQFSLDAAMQCVDSSVFTALLHSPSMVGETASATATVR